MNRKVKNILIYLNYWRTIPAYLLARGSRFLGIDVNRILASLTGIWYGGGVHEFIYF